jgi:cytochrome P450
LSGAKVPDGPAGRRITGNLHDFASAPLEFLAGVARDFGPVAALRFGRTRAFLLNDPSLIEQVMVTRRLDFIKSRPLRAQRRVFGNGLLTNEGDSWRRQRRLAQPAFHRDRIALYGDVIVQQTSALVDSMHAGDTEEIHSRFKALTVAIVSTALFGAEVAHRAAALGDALEATMNRYASRRGFARFAPDWFPLPINRTYLTAVSEIEKTVLEIIARRRAEPANRADLLSVLMEARYEDGSAMSDTQLRDEAVTLFLGGIDTPALALTWCWYLLSQNPEATEMLAREVDSVLDGRPATFADLPRLCVTEMAVKEAMRLYPPAWLLSRDATKDTRIGEWDIPAGASVLMSPYLMHRNRSYFRDADTFEPERWRDGQLDSLPRFAYFPFGGGPRVCIGASFAMMEMVLCLATIASRLRFTLAETANVVASPSMTLRPLHGVHIVVEPRTAGLHQ